MEYKLCKASYKSCFEVYKRTEYRCYVPTRNTNLAQNVDSIIAEIDRTVKAINDDTLLVFKNSKSGNKLVSIDPSYRMVQKVRNGYRTKVGYGKKTL